MIDVIWTAIVFLFGVWVGFGWSAAVLRSRDARIEKMEADDRERHKIVDRIDARLKGELRIAADRLEVAGGACKEWSDKLRALGQERDKHGGDCVIHNSIGNDGE